MELPPNWTFKIYAQLWNKYKDKKFSNQEAQEIIQNSNLNQALSRLKNTGWLKITLNPKDSRKSLYELKKPEQAIQEVIQNTAEK